jgi:hypothetical protein
MLQEKMKKILPFHMLQVKIMAYACDVLLLQKQ